MLTMWLAVAAVVFILNRVLVRDSSGHSGIAMIFIVPLFFAIGGTIHLVWANVLNAFFLVHLCIGLGLAAFIAARRKYEDLYIWSSIAFALAVVGLFTAGIKVMVSL